MHKKIFKKTKKPFIKFKKKFISSLHNSKSEKKIIARSVFIGFLFAFTPLVGVQMYILAIYWFLVRKIKSLKFDYLPAFILLWISNFATLPFLYWLWYKNGIIILKIFGIKGFLSFHKFIGMIKVIIYNHSLTHIDKIIQSSNIILSKFGLPVIIGGLFEGIIIGTIGYHLTLKYLNNREKKLKLKNKNV